MGGRIATSPAPCRGRARTAVSKDRLAAAIGVGRGRGIGLADRPAGRARIAMHLDARQEHEAANADARRLLGEIGGQIDIVAAIGCVVCLAAPVHAGEEVYDSRAAVEEWGPVGLGRGIAHGAAIGRAHLAACGAKVTAEPRADESGGAGDGDRAHGVGKRMKYIVNLDWRSWRSMPASAPVIHPTGCRPCDSEDPSHFHRAGLRLDPCFRRAKRY